MKTWIICIERAEATVSQLNRTNGALSAGGSIAPPRGSTPQKFARYLAAEMELACGVGTSSDLIICCAQRVALDEFGASLSPEVKGNVLGILPRGLITKTSRRLKASALAALKVPVWQTA